MDWNRTKTIFIVTFLMLNVFLTWQLIETNSANQISMITEATIQERLNQMNVTIDVELPEEELPGLHMIGKNASLTNATIPLFSNQDVEIVDDRMILSILDEPFELRSEQFSADLTMFLSTYIYEGDEYRYGGYDADTRQILLYQIYEGKTAYTFGDEPLILQLDESQRIVGYQQSYFEFEEQEGREREMLSSLKAIEVLLNDQIIGSNDSVTSIEFGYYSLFSPQGNVQVFAPMWRVIVDEEAYFVNAIEGSVQQFS